MSDVTPSKILVDHDVHLRTAAVPRRLTDSLRRQIRQRGGGRSARASLPALLESRSGEHRLPQALLPLVTETSRRQRVPIEVDDRRAAVPCPRLRTRMQLGPREQRALNHLLRRDSGVLVAVDGKRHALAMELLARRQQRSLVLAPSPDQAARWLERLQEAMDLSFPRAAPLGRADEQSSVVTGTYDDVAGASSGELWRRFGMVVFDGLSRADPTSLVGVIRRVPARHLLGLAESPVRADELQDYIFLALGGHVQRLDETARALVPVLRSRRTGFQFQYQGRHQYQALVKALAGDPRRCQLVVDDVLAEARAGHPCLVLSERRDHLEQMAALLPADVGAEALTSAVRPAERQRLVQRFDQGQVPVLLATSQVARESVDTRRVGRLFFTFPFTYARKLERCHRWLVHPYPGQTDAALYDYDDELVEPLHRSFLKRREVFSRLRRRLGREAQLELPL
jgi:superfamily II DNA or RNA helicase